MIGASVKRSPSFSGPGGQAEGTNQSPARPAQRSAKSPQMASLQLHRRRRAGSGSDSAPAAMGSCLPLDARLAAVA